MLELPPETLAVWASGPPVDLRFYVEVLGFTVRFARPAERFVYLERDGVELMLEAAVGPGRRFRTAPLEQPYGRGINFQLAVADVDAVHARAVDVGAPIIVPMEERWYRVGDDRATSARAIEAGNRQFVVADPDGYLWRPYRDLGARPATIVRSAED